MQTRKWNIKKDYPFISDWCKKRNWDLPIPKELLASEGIVVEEDQIICAAVLYIDQESGFSYMYGIFSDPGTSKIKLFRAMKICIDEMVNLAKSKKLKFLYTTTGETALHRLYEKHSKLKNCEDNLKSYVIRLDEEKYNDLDWISEDRPDNLWGKNGKN